MGVPESFAKHAGVRQRSGHHPRSGYHKRTISHTRYARRVAGSVAILALAGLLSGSPLLSAPDGGGPTPAGGVAVNGFGGVAWKSTYTAARSHLKNLVRSSDSNEKVEIISEDRNRYILVKRNDVLYRYNFYKTPLIVERIENHRMTQDEYDEKEALFYHVKVSMPLIPADRILERLQRVYGRSTKSTVDKKKLEGAEIWELEGGLIFAWSEPFRKIAFTRDIDYLSREMAAMIMKEYANYFDARERLILKQLEVK